MNLFIPLENSQVLATKNTKLLFYIICLRAFSTIAYVNITHQSSLTSMQKVTILILSTKLAHFNGYIITFMKMIFKFRNANISMLIIQAEQC